MQDLHVWALSDGKIAITAHLTVQTGTIASEKDQILQRCDTVLRQKFDLNHFSIQVEDEGYVCGNDLHT